MTVVCVFVCVFVYVFICVFVYVFVCACVCVFVVLVSVFLFVLVSVFACVCVCVLCGHGLFERFKTKWTALFGGRGPIWMARIASTWRTPMGAWCGRSSTLGRSPWW